MDYRLFPPEELIDARVELPLSKSMSNRALAIAALTPGAPMPQGLAECDDVSAMQSAVASADDNVNVGPAGTAMRFLTAVFAATEGRNVILDGSERMRHRPIAPLVEALRACGASIEYLGQEGYPPLRIEGKRLTGGTIEMDASVSSQFVSALLMAGPVMEQGLTLRLSGDVNSAPYVSMTLAMMSRAGAKVEREDFRTVRVAAGEYAPVGWAIEPDWSAAAFWYELEAMSSGFLSVTPMKADSVQGDSLVARIYEKFGVVTEFEGEDGRTDLCASPEVAPRFDADMSDTPDLVIPVAVTCAMLQLPFRISGVATLRVKETDRIAALTAELGKFGVRVNAAGDDTIEWDGRILPMVETPVIETYSDHRIAMAFAPVALYVPGIVIRDADVVNKSYPGFWDNLFAAGFRAENPDETEE